MRKQICDRLPVRCYLVFLLAWVIALFGVQSFRAEQTNAVLVDDMAGLLSEDEEASLLTAASSLSDLAQLDVMMVTTDDANGYSSEKYGDQYYLDHDTSDDGVLYLIDMDNREIHISTSGVMIYYLTDQRIDRCLDDGYEQMSNGKYAACFHAMIRDTISYVKSGKGADYYTDRDTGEVTYKREPEKKKITSLEALLAAAAGLLAGGGTMLGVFGKYRMKFGGYSYDYHQNHTLKLYRSTDHFRTRTVTRRHIPRDNGGGHSGGGGGSTTHSSGGHSFGGGSRKF